MIEWVKKLAGEVLTATELPPESLPDGEAAKFVWGLLFRSRRLLVGVQLLEQNDLSDVSAGLTRAALEDAITATWVAESLQDRYLVIAGDYPRSWEALKKDWPDLTTQVGLTEEEIEAMNRIQSPERLDAVERRAKAVGLGGMYRHYRVLSWMHHSTFVAGSVAIRVSEEGSWPQAGHLFVTATATLQTAAAAENALQLGLRSKLDALTEQLVQVRQRKRGG